MVLEKELIRLRQESGLSQLQVAEILNVSRQTVSRWECGESVPNAENLAALSRLFGVSVEALINGGEEPDAEPEQAEDNVERESPPEPQAEPARRTPLRDILWPVCLLAACIVVCATIILIVYARPWERDGQNETEVVPITDLEQKQIEILPEDHIEFDP